MARSLEPQPVGFRQMYFALRSDTADKLKVKAAQERKYVKQIISELVEAYVNGKITLK